MEGVSAHTIPSLVPLEEPERNPPGMPVPLIGELNKLFAAV